MSIYTLTFFGGMPLGALWSGTLAGIIGAPPTVVVSALVVLAFALFLWIAVPSVRRLT
jgi:fucose permease